MISFRTAQSFLSTGTPTAKQLCSIFSTSAPLMRVLREKLNLNLDERKEVDLYDLRRTIQEWYHLDKDSFDSTFPGMIPEKFMKMRTVKCRGNKLETPIVFSLTV
jgi:hypothetical protein